LTPLKPTHGPRSRGLPDDAGKTLLNAALRAVLFRVKRVRKLKLMAEEYAETQKATGQDEGTDWARVAAQQKARCQQTGEWLHLIADRYKQMLRAYNQTQPCWGTGFNGG
jgi:hypothetical protein